MDEPNREPMFRPYDSRLSTLFDISNDHIMTHPLPFLLEGDHRGKQTTLPSFHVIHLPLQFRYLERPRALIQHAAPLEVSELSKWIHEAKILERKPEDPRFDRSPSHLVAHFCFLFSTCAMTGRMTRT